jgi:tRNA threonylcarbamoyladenosine biosynthesis protein TsaE
MHIATNSGKIEISLEVKTAELAKNFSKILKKGDVVFLYGKIGVGKTTFVRNLINNCQKKRDLEITEVTSPTFNLVNEYDLGDILVQHYDLFRLKNIDETKNIGFLENYKEIITLVEWPEKIKKKSINTIDLIFEYGEDMEKRFLTINGLTKKRLNEIR